MVHNHQVQLREGNSRIPVPDFFEWPVCLIYLHIALRQYADYALWQRKWLEQGESQRCLKYWRGKLEGVPH